MKKYNNVNLHVPTMHCMHCVGTIKNALLNVDGVKKVDANLQTKIVCVKVAEDVNPSTLANVVTEAGFEATIA